MGEDHVREGLWEWSISDFGETFVSRIQASCSAIQSAACSRQR